ncbi:Acetyl-coenzyme A synthetase [Labrenzia sp. THAF191b]|uniref:acyl-CoA synthetase n=1 Tax=unclassified Labrenzia TaxID=2648686 RepID=UPI001268FAB0|nr:MULTISPECIES: acyl-CoA synthetase [unclassified Labrenzia]QFS97606.1 Acetyl-coenzyme A synthetase [Labrenzia sp. THAF191b]QFT03921.1 Acetyl-coenzyme A synthetase [Labrenzia sp. THAF191a]QFT15463.1 Acetyl-coenzyme A synthetase [Labrenzia sp. THAF187b]
MLPHDATTYDDLSGRFRWEIPDRFNIGVAICDDWAAREPNREALVYTDEDGSATSYTYGDLRRLSNQLANLLTARGVQPGDRIGVLMPQRPETAFSHIAALKLGAITIPLFTLFGEEALEYRLKDSGAKAVITDASGSAKLATIRDRLPELTTVLCADEDVPGAESLHHHMAGHEGTFHPFDTGPDDPAIIIYTSGTTGQPKGALHGHRVLLGHLPGVEMSHDLLGQPGDRIWTPADWAWIGGLLDVLMPALFLGVPVVACRFRKFTAEAAFQLLQDQKIRNTFLPPTALKMMRQVEAPENRWQFTLRSVASGGETLGAELIDWGRRTFGLTINEFYGQTECNMIVSSCASLMEARPGIMGRPVPGHHVSVVSDTGEELPAGSLGNIAVRRPDPVMFLNYWNNMEATEKKFAGDWLLTGDTGIKDDTRWIRFVGRDDDVITSSGYRIGPGEIEDCLIKHPAVAMAGVVGKPDSQRTEIVKAYIVLKNGIEPTDKLAGEIADFVKTRLAAHEYPREVAFVDALPLTTTGKVIRRELRARAEQEE